MMMSMEYKVSLVLSFVKADQLTMLPVAVEG